jgi:DNA repair exonuclease SbcCD ATPase subunit
MRVNRIIISNVLGIEHMDISPGTVTQVTGHNGAGKTSVVEAVKAALKGGHDATLLRNGTDKGEVVLLLDDGTEIKKTITADKSDVKVKGPTGRGGVGVLDQLRDIVSVNPIEFLTASPKRQLEILLESIDIDLTVEELENAAGILCNIHGSALEAIDGIYKAIYDERTGINRALKEKQATHAQLCETIPTGVAEDPNEEISTITAEINEISGRDRTLRSELELWKAKELQRINDEYQAKTDKLNKEFNAAVAPLHERVAVLNEQLTQKGRFEQQRKIIAQMEAEVEQLQEEAQKKTAALERLKALKASKMESLPFPGLAIVEGQILMQGVPFERLNASEQVKFAINLAVRRASDLKLICVDGLELIDPTRYQKFIDAVAKMTDYQFIVTRVSDQPLEVETR